MKVRARPCARTAGRRVDVDLFAGGGGAGEGKRRATGRSADVAVNHWLAAGTMYSANHPTTRVLIDDVRNVKPLEATGGRLVRFLWGSPTCVHFSRASGRRLSPEAVKIRALADVVFAWLDDTQPEVMFIENVIEFLGWGPVYDQHDDGCPGAHDETGDSCEDWCKYGRAIPELKGTLFNAWRAGIEARGYSFEYRILTAWEFGAPTTRERLYIVCRRDGRSFDWPMATHTRPELVGATGLKPWRTAAEIIDWSIPCPSIFDRVKPHVPATRRRLARGMRKFVLEAERPFLMHLTHGDRHAPHSIDDPVPTVTAANRGEQSLVVPYAIHMGNGERPEQEPRIYDVRAPYPTVVGDGGKARPVVAFLAKAYTERETGGFNGGSDLGKPIGVVTAQDHHHLVAAGLVRYHGERRPDEEPRGQGLDEPITTLDASNRFGLMAAHAVKFYGTSTGSDVRGPVHTITASDRGGGHIGVVAASLLRYNGKSIGQQPDAPIGTLDATDRYALLNYDCAAEWNDIVAAKARRVYRFLVAEGIDGPWLDHEHELVRLPGTELVIYDIGMRMLVPRELFRANGFHDSYLIELVGPRGKPLTKTEQVRLVGNSVVPQVAEALIRAALNRTQTRRCDPCVGAPAQLAHSGGCVMPARDDARLGQPVPTGEPLDHVCPCCNGTGDRSAMECVCNGLGVITAELAREFAAVEPSDPAWAPRPLAAVPEYDGTKCHDCAFRPNSLERDGSTGVELFDQLSLGNGEGRPFYCHHGMHHGAQGYVPRQRDMAGAPIGHPVCAGWLQLYTARATRSA